MPRIQRKPKGLTHPGVIRGLFFGLTRGRPTPVSFSSMVPQDEGFGNPQYIKVEQQFSKKVPSNRIHDCIVVVGRDTFLVSAYWEEGDSPNRAVEAACPGLEWHGEITVVQVGRFVTYYKQVRRHSIANRAVSRFISEYKYSAAVGAPLPMNIRATS